jgi:hypothetical protein
MVILRSSGSLLSLGMLLFSGCSSSPERYPGTDVLTIPGLEIESAMDLLQSGGTLQSGMLVYRGEGDLKDIFQIYVQAMEREGWMTTYANFNGDAGTATLRKDKRLARIAFSNGKKKLTASIQVGPATLMEPDSGKDSR